jgi:hypothetical protein
MLISLITTTTDFDAVFFYMDLFKGKVYTYINMSTIEKHFSMGIALEAGANRL